MPDALTGPARRPVTDPGDAVETEAQRVADHVTDTGRPPDGFRTRAPAPGDRPSGLGPGAPLDPTLRRAFAGILGDGGADVRLHTGDAAERAAAASGARAVTIGSHIAFGRGELAPGTTEGRRLLAHELTHTVQGRGRSHGPAMRQPKGSRDPGGQGFVPPHDLVNPQLPATVDLPTTVEMPGPSLDPSKQRRDRDTQQLVFTMPVRKVADYRFFTVPIASVFGTAREAARSHLPTPEVLTRTPAHPVGGGAQTGSVTPSTAAVPPTVQNVTATRATTAPDVDLTGVTPAEVHPIQGPPRFGVGSTVFTPDGIAHTVLGATPTSLVTETYTKYAVGAGSTSLLRSGKSYVVVDAGVFGLVSDDVRTETIRRIRAEIGPGGEIATVLITHAHVDHMDLLPQLARNFRIGSIRINALQADRPDFADILKEVRDAHRALLTDEARSVGERLEGERRAWEAADRGDPLTRGRRWGEHRDTEMRKALDAIPDIMLERIAPGVRGRLAITSLPIDPAMLAPPESTRAVPAEALVPGVRAPAVVDPGFADELDERAGRGPTDKTLDRFSSSWLIDVRGRARFIVMPDLRGEDMRRLLQDFRKQMSELGMEARFQVWDVSHHMQIGWSGGGKAGAAPASSVRATQLGNITRFLHQFRAGTPAAPGTDIVVVSAYEGFKPGRSYVDPANVFILKSLGFHVFLATAGADVQVLRVLTSQGKEVTGVVGAARGGTPPQRELLRTTEAALAELRDGIRIQRQVLKRLKPGAADQAARTTAQTELDRLTRLNGELDALRLRYLDAVHQDMAHSTRSSGGGPASGTPPTPPPALEPEAGRALIERLRSAGMDRPVPTSGDPRFSEAALAIIRPDLLDATAAKDTPTGRALELAAARSRIREIESRSPTSVDPVKQRAELLSELHRYRIALEEQIRQMPQGPGATGSSRQVLDDELRTARQRIRELTPGDTIVGVKQRMPVTGAMVETKVLSAERLKPTEPGVTADPAAPKPGVGQRAGSFIEGASGRGFGALMVYQTITGEGDVLSRAAAGKAGAAEVAATTAHNALGITLGLKMLRGVPVPGGAFVVLSILEVAEAASREYASPDQRNTEIAYAVLRGGVNLGLMAAGGFLMGVIPPPFGILAGLGVMMLGDVILDALGAHDWVERMMSFQPRQVTQVEQDLRDLLKEYDLLVGAMSLHERSLESLKSVGATEPMRAKVASSELADEQLLKAYPLEKKILSHFADAYDRAQTAFAGLQELDLMRTHFYEQLTLVHKNDDELPAFNYAREVLLSRYRDNAGYLRQDWLNRDLYGMSEDQRFLAQNKEITPVRDLARQTFEKIERDLSMSGMKPGDVPGMEQWDKIDGKLDELNGRMMQSYFAKKDSNIPYDDYTDMLSEAQRMVANAHYRVDPSAGGYRTQPLLERTHPAYQTYMDYLEPRERRLWWTQHRMGDMIAGRTPYPRGIGELATTWEQRESPPDAKGAMDVSTNLRGVDRALASYDVRIEQAPKPPEELRQAIFLNSADAKTRYGDYVDDHDDYKRALLVIELTQTVLAGLMDHARRAIDPTSSIDLNVVSVDPDKEKLRQRMVRFRQLFRHRYDELGLLFPSETADLAAKVRQGEQDILRAQLKVPVAAPELTAEEQHAAQEKRIKEAAPRLGTTADRLERIPQLRLSLPPAHVTGISRLTEPIEGFHHAQAAVDTEATRSRNALVGEVREGKREIVMYGRYGVAYPTRVVIALNAAAIQALGTTDEVTLRTERLAPVTLDEVKP